LLLAGEPIRAAVIFAIDGGLLLCWNYFAQADLEQSKMFLPCFGASYLSYSQADL